jgi:hypothetical protein
VQAEQYKRQLARLEQREEERFGTSEGLAVDSDDVSCRPVLVLCVGFKMFWFNVLVSYYVNTALAHVGYW